MERDDPCQPHLSLRCTSQRNEDMSRHVASEFCKAYEKQFRVVASVIDVETENVDAIIRVGEVDIAVELVSYRQRDEHHEIEHADSRIKQLISSRFAESGLPPFEIRIWWGAEQRIKQYAGQSAKRTKVPRGQAAMDLADEIIKLAVLAQENDLCDKHISFCNNPGATNRHAPSGWTFVDSASFSVASEYCFWIELTPWPYSFRPTIHSSVDVRKSGLDRVQLATAIRDKLGKLDRYRQGIAGKPLWLIAHSDGHPLSTRLPPGLEEDALAVIRQEIQKVSCSFDRVWWAQNTGFLDAAELYEVLPHSCSGTAS